MVRTRDGPFPWIPLGTEGRTGEGPFLRPRTTRPPCTKHSPTISSGRQMRMQFLRVAQMHPPKDRQTALSMFAAFVNSTFEKG